MAAKDHVPIDDELIQDTAEAYEPQALFVLGMNLALELKLVADRLAAAHSAGMLGPPTLEAAILTLKDGGQQYHITDRSRTDEGTQTVTLDYFMHVGVVQNAISAACSVAEPLPDRTYIYCPTTRTITFCLTIQKFMLLQARSLRVGYLQVCSN